MIISKILRYLVSFSLLFNLLTQLFIYEKLGGIQVGKELLVLLCKHRNEICFFDNMIFAQSWKEIKFPC